MIDYVQMDDLLAAARATFGQEAQVRDWGLVESALTRPQATVFGNQAYPWELDSSRCLSVCRSVVT